MPQRRETPDVLGEILGGDDEGIEVQPAPASLPKKGKTSKQIPRRLQKTEWAYLEVIFRDYAGYRPLMINGEENPNWKQEHVIYEYLNQLGAEGWELVSVTAVERNQMRAYLKRPKG